jgi:glycosyltransferase involved in cell wall biosynthesis
MKKGAHVLLRAALELLQSGMPRSLIIARRVLSEEKNYWEKSLRDCVESFPRAFSFHGWLPPNQVNAMLRESHIYVSATLGEGCSLGHAGALTLGIPIVATRTGALPELCRDAGHVRLCAPGSVSACLAELRAMIQDVLRGSVCVDRERVLAWRRHLAPQAEREQWEREIAEVSV